MEQQSCIREFFRYTLFGILGTLGVSCYILADTFFVSKGLGTNGLAALNLAIPVYNFIHGTGLMIGMGGATKFSVLKSQGHRDSVNRLYTNTVYLAILFSAFFMLTGLLFSGQMASALGADRTIWKMTDIYLRWLMFFSPAFLFNDVLLCFVRNDEGPQLAMGAMIIGSLGNIVLDYIFIFPFDMGIFGAVFATGISPVISMLILLPHWLKHHNSFRLVKTGILMNMVGAELSLGFPSLIAQLSSGIVMIVFNSIILGMNGNTGVAAYGIIANISLVVTAIYTGIAQGVQPLISRFYGAGNRDSIRKVQRYAMGTMLILSGVLYGSIFLFSRPIVAAFNSEQNVALEAIAVTGLKLYFISAPFTGYNILLATVFTSTEQALPAHILSILRGFVLILPTAFLLSALWEMTGVWITCLATELLTALPGFVIEKNNRKETDHEN